MNTKSILTALKIALTPALIFFLVQRIGAEILVDTFRSIRPWFLLAIPVILLVETVIRTFSWRQLLGSRGLEVSFPRLLQVNMSGAFFGTFLPSSLGTDLARTTMLTTEENVRAEESLSSILMLNLLGLIALCVLALGGVLLMGDRIENRGLAQGIAIGSIFGIAAVSAFFFGSSPVLKALHIPIKLRESSRLDNFESAIATYIGDRKTIALVLGLALISQVMTVLLVYFLSMSVDSGTPLMLLIVLVPAITLLRLVPLSFAGFGAEQGIFVYLFVQAGQNATDAFVISILLSIVVLLFALVGGVIYGLRILREAIGYRDDPVPAEEAVGGTYELS